MQQALEIAVQHGRSEGADRIVRLSLSVGAMSGVEPTAMEFAFDVVSQGTIAEGAALVIESDPGFDLRVTSIEVC